MSTFYSNFNYSRYRSNLYFEEGELSAPGDDTLANKGMTIEFEHIPTGHCVKFKAFINSFAESYTPSWEADEVFGRSDPIYLFKDTERSISLGFRVPAASAGEAYENLGKVQKLVQFLYATYKDPSQAQTIVQSPLVRLKVMNFTRNADNLDIQASSETQSYLNYNMDGQGLLGTINNLSIDHGLAGDYGVVELPGSDGAFRGILPKLIEVSLEFSALHEHNLGWNEQDQFGKAHFDTGVTEDGSAFPYGTSFGDPSLNGAPQPESEMPPETDPPPPAPTETDPEDSDPDADLPTDDVVPAEQDESEADPISEDSMGDDAEIDAEEATEEETYEDLDTTDRERTRRRWWPNWTGNTGPVDRSLGGVDPYHDTLSQYTGRTYNETTNVQFRETYAPRGPDIDPGSLFTEEEREMMMDDPGWLAEWSGDSTTGVGGDDY
tara:strand:+ start:1367 stop:2677 length:1311 start_codon:yes stop_codon:yes gene_type:complete